MIDKNKLNIVSKYLREVNDPVKGRTRFPTDEEVLAGREIFYNLIDIANLLGQDMLAAWAINQYTNFNNCAWSRDLINSAGENFTPKFE